MVAVTLLGTALLALSSQWLSAQQDEPALAAREWVRAEGADLIFDLPAEKGKQVSLHDLMLLTGRITGIRFSLVGPTDETSLQQEKVVIYGRKRVPRSALYEFFQTILKLHGFACTEVNADPLRLVRIVRLQGEGIQAIRSNIPYISPSEIPRYAIRPASLVMTIFPLRYIDPNQAFQLLNRLFPNPMVEGFASLSAGSVSQQALLVYGFGPTLGAIQNLLREIDQPKDPNWVEPAPGQEVLVHCEVWTAQGAELLSRIEELSERGADSAAVRELVLKSNTCKRQARFVGAVVLEEPPEPIRRVPAQSTQTQGRKRSTVSRIQGSHVQTELSLSCILRKGGAITTSLAMEVKELRQQTGRDRPVTRTARLDCSTTAPVGEMRMIETGIQDECTTLVFVKVIKG